MSGALYAIFVVGILVVIQWYVANERIGQNSDGSKGLLAMLSARETKTNGGAVGGDGPKQDVRPTQAAIKSKPDW